MRYEFMCHVCGSNAIKSLKIDDRDKNINCNWCGNQMSRCISAGGTSVQLGCMKSSKKNGVGCYVDSYGKVHAPKSRGEEKTRRFRVHKKI